MRTRRIRLLQILGWFGVTVLVGAIVLTNRREIGLRRPDGPFISIGSGCVQVGVNLARFQAGYQVVPEPAYIIDSWHNDWTLAWRPFHVNMGPSERYIVVPLWLPALVMVLLAGYSTGALAGLRAARSSSCLVCAYPLLAPPPGHTRAQCPECGTWRTFFV